MQNKKFFFLTSQQQKDKNPNVKWAKYLKRLSSKEDTQAAKKNIEKKSQYHVVNVNTNQNDNDTPSYIHLDECDYRNRKKVFTTDSSGARL